MCLAADPRLALAAIAVAFVVAAAGSARDESAADDVAIAAPPPVIGRIIAFGGGLPRYDARDELLGALGVSGETSSAGHVIAWQVRHALGVEAAGPPARKRE